MAGMPGQALQRTHMFSSEVPPNQAYYKKAMHRCSKAESCLTIVLN